MLTGKSEVRDVAIMDALRLQFVDEGSNKFLADLSLAANGYNITWWRPGPVRGEAERLAKLMGRYTEVMQMRLCLGQNVEGCSLLVRSLDMFGG